MSRQRDGAVPDEQEKNLFETLKKQITALDLGADDYLTKPFGTDELLARVRTAIRHTRTASGNDEIARQGTYTVGEMTIDYNKHQVLMRGENVKLTLSEFRIVALLGKYAGKVLTYDFIIRELWGPRAGGNNQILRVNMANIRRKIEKTPPSRSIFSRRWAWVTGWRREVEGQSRARGVEFTKNHGFLWKCTLHFHNPFDTIPALWKRGWRRCRENRKLAKSLSARRT